MKTKQTIHRFIGFLFLGMLILIASCQPCDCEDSAVSADEPKGIISTEEAKELFKGYTSERVPKVLSAVDSAEREGFLPTRYIAFNYKNIKNYMAYIEGKANSVDVDIDTLRIYLGVYSKNHPRDGGKATVFLVPATSSLDGKSRAFHIAEEGGRKFADSIPWNFGTDIKQMGQLMEKEPRQYAGFGPSPLKTNIGPVLLNGSLILNDGNSAPPPWH